MATQQKRKCVVCTLQRKLEVLQRLDNELEVGVTTIKDWKKGRKELVAYLLTVEREDALKKRKKL
ncbi:hypothetical protein PR048_004560 [Dryococelus australis]|uniref:Uncharacterized protein n=1 Tax=Dryococelus australis TaxID=614101 RepID=A0ABQ9I5T3_9NEOP|nr:hypothetical protein PR048_004560 [Dryococelus australis]